MDLIIRFLVSLVPVVLFLFTLNYLDSFRLVRARSIFIAMLVGVAVALVSLTINDLIMNQTGLSRSMTSRYVAPLIEETLKASWVAWLMYRRRVGFMVDAAITGFAVGTGFALIENTYYLNVLESHNIGVWVVRGLGTAVMHGGMTAIYGIVTRTLIDRWGGRWSTYTPALGTVIVLHSIYNHFILPPVTATILLHIVLPTTLLLAFRASERATRHWLGSQMDVDAELLEIVESGSIGTSRIGFYTAEMQRQFDPEMVVDMLCYMRIHLELAIAAKGLLMMREAGFKPPVPDGTREKFAELKHLEKNIGITGLLAIKPLLHKSTRDIWQIYQLDA
ncbi:MAG TPA: PrsW family glutamic-type intramembrane protease [Candidatus Krumholzibacteria bacterium]